MRERPERTTVAHARDVRPDEWYAISEPMTVAETPNEASGDRGGGARELRRIPTGVPGLDTVLAGGLFEAGLYMVQGPPGAGKTILGNQICFHQAAQQRRTVYYTLLTEAHDRMIAFVQPLRFFDPAAVPERVSYVSGFQVLEAHGLSGIVRNLGEILGAERPTILVIDGVVTATEAAPTGTAFKKFLHELQTLAAMFRTTILLLTSTRGAARTEAEHTMVDGIIELAMSVVRLKLRRTLHVRKLRGAGQIGGTHTFEIGDAGITVLPRIETLLAARAPRLPPASAARRAFDIPALDALLGGGIPAGSNTMLIGPSGAGKTVLGLHFLAAGAAAGEPGLLVTFYEQPGELIAKATRLGLASFGPAIERGLLRILRLPSVEANIDRIGNDLLAVSNEARPARIFLDGLHGFQSTTDAPDRIDDILAAASDYLVSHGVTLVFTVETPELLGDPVLRVPFQNASRICQNILALRFAELGGRLRRLFSVIKLRDSGFDPTVRELIIGDRGIELGDPIASAQPPVGGGVPL
ncbi:MAG TPA: ATPase domain-containing protein [Kofleriaceae bacterium]|nr:ATPase domain-containing protein [Kofleriaceae bacterium]